MRIRRYLNLKTATMLADALVSSKLDYYNTPMAGTSEKDLSSMQLVQNTLYQVVCRVPVLEVPLNFVQMHEILTLTPRINFKIRVDYQPNIMFPVAYGTNLSPTCVSLLASK